MLKITISEHTLNILNTYFLTFELSGALPSASSWQRMRLPGTLGRITTGAAVFPSQGLCKRWRLPSCSLPKRRPCHSLRSKRCRSLLGCYQPWEFEKAATVDGHSGGTVARSQAKWHGGERTLGPWQFNSFFCLDCGVRQLDDFLLRFLP